MTDSPDLFNPFPGLRPFEPNEDFLFFGREEQVDELLRRLRERRFLSVVGTSGSGKSSLVRAGLLPALFGGFMVQAGSRWRVAVIRPGHDPIASLADALSAPEVLGSQTGQSDMLRALLETTLRRSTLGLVEAVRQGRLPQGENLLIVVDQFEELFRYRASLGKSSSDEAAAFIWLLLEAVHQADVPIFVTLTMRSDFLGDCSQFAGLPQAINAGQYLIPRLSRDEIQRAITGPIAVGGGEIAPQLVQRLLGDVGDNPDHLPILQHALMRTWDDWTSRRQEGEPIQIRHYEAVGGMNEALSRHADEAYLALSTERRELVERVFRCLTEKGSDNREIRRPIRLRNLCAAVDSGAGEVAAVLEPFRRRGRSFLMPPAGADLEDETVIDVSHESLMRVWGRLRAWVEEEAQSAATYRRLAETALLYEAGQAGLWRDPDLAIALTWRAEDRPNAAWAERYGSGFERAMRFLDASQKANLEKIQARELKRRQELVRSRRFALVLGVAFLLALGSFVVALHRERQAQEQADLARSRQLALESARLFGVDNDAALLLAIESARAAPSRAAETALRAALLNPGRTELLLEGHRKQVWDAVWSPGGDRVVTVSRDGTARIWSGRAAPLILAGHQAGVQSADWDREGRRIVTASYDGTARVWDARTGAQLRLLAGHAAALNQAVWDPAGERIATASFDGTVRIWNATQGSLVAVLEEPAGTADEHRSRPPVVAVAWSPDGQRLATGSRDGTARIWSGPAFARSVKLEGHGDGVQQVAWDAAGGCVATASFDRTIRVWQADGAPVAVLEGHTDAVNMAVWSPRGDRIVSASRDGTARVWDARSFGLIATLAGHAGEVRSAAWNGKGQVVTAGADGTARVWDAAGGGVLAVLARHREGLENAAWSPRGDRVVTASLDATARIWDVEAGNEADVLRGFGSGVSRIAWSPDGTRLAAASFDGTARIWSPGSRVPPLVLPGDRAGLVDVAWEPTGRRLLCAGRGGIVRLFRADGSPLATLAGGAGLRHAAWSPDGRRIAAAGLDGIVRVWEAAAGRLAFALPDHRDWISSVAWSPGGTRLVSAGFDGTARLWSAEDRGSPLAVLGAAPAHGSAAPAGHESAVLFAAWSPDGTRVATTGADSTARVWDAASGEQLALMSGEGDWVRSAAWSPDGSRIATAGANRRPVGLAAAPGTARVWDARTGQLLLALKGHQDRLTAVEWGPGGAQIVTASEDGEARVWNSADGELHTVLHGHTGRLNQAAWSPDGSRIATAGADGSVRVYFTSIGELAAAACRRAVRELTAEEWTRYLAAVPRRPTCPPGRPGGRP
ncbi:MAG TPA: WD40 repeat domain-containing protein [Thermoanaerobaculia bacterium]|nr:WD40 repeat domain-containing protein [Thermoanaerobaculia bacterium]